MNALAPIIALAVLAGTPPAAGTAGPAGTVVLDENSHWRLERTWVPGLARTADGRLAPLVPGAGLKGPGHALVFKPGPGEKFDLPKWPALPADWAAPAFDDSAWSLHRGPVSVNDCYSMRFAFTPRWNFSLARLRGRFLVDDPAAVGELKLDLVYQGGAVVYLNGAEIARGHLPEGKIAPETPAADYADAETARRDEWVRADKMDRRLAGVAIPAAKLVRG
nr:secreted protein [uncultured microorganism]